PDPRRDAARRARSRCRACRSTSSLRLAHLVQGVLRGLDRHVGVLHAGLAREARRELEPPRLVEKAVLLLGGGLERLEALAHDHVAGRAGAALLASVLDLDPVAEERIAY